VSTRAKKRRSHAKRDVFGIKLSFHDVNQINGEHRKVRMLRHIGKARQYLVTWDTRVKEIVAIRERDGKPTCELVFDDGFRFEYSLSTVREQCPQALIHFLLKQQSITS
jgi:hypothetical protein